MTDEELEAIVDEMAAAGGMSGMGIGTIYGDLALDVAKAVRERCAAACDAEAMRARMRNEFGAAAGAEDCATVIRSVA